MRSRTVVLVLVHTASLSVSAPALAQPADTHGMAEEQFRLGREAMNGGDCNTALKLLRTSQGLEAGRGKVLNIALCEEKLGLYASAKRHFEQVLPQLDTKDDRIAIVQQHLAAIASKVPFLRIALAPGAPAGTTVALDGEEVPTASLGSDAPVDPGTHVIVVNAPGAQPVRREVTVAEGGKVAVTLGPEPAPAALLPAASAVPIAPAPKERGLGWTLGLASVSAGGASLVVGVATGAAAAAKHASTAKLCPAPNACPPEVQPDIDTYNRLGAASTATFILGGALAATGVVLLLVSRQAEARAPVTSVGVLAGLGTLGVRGSFQ